MSNLYIGLAVGLVCGCAVGYFLGYSGYKTSTAAKIREYILAHDISLKDRQGKSISVCEFIGRTLAGK
ncbi:hypothetical protein JW935_08230 [candidate division KSB1 bacterium]|nr:hypothetical protein [candidate division KSB1 bacterium]